MKRLPLYGAEVRAPVERTTPKDRDAWPEVGNDSDSDLRGRACQDCALGETAKRPCIGADGRGYEGPGGVLIVGDVPSRDDESCGRLFVTGTGSKLRNAVQSAGITNVVYDVALRCYPGKNLSKDKVMTKAMEACRPYLHQTIVEAEPSRVIAMGARAARSIIDAHVPINSVRRGYTWLYNHGKAPVPVFFLNHPVMAARNKFYGAEFDKDLQWALTCDVPTPPPWRAHARLVESWADAQLAYDELNTAEWITFDFETGGRLFNEDFQGLCVAVGGRGSDSPFVWNYAGVYDDMLIWPLQKLLKDPAVKVVGQYVKYDILCALEALGVRTTNVYGDTRLWQKVGNPEADAFLDKMAHLVGMGGHKEEAKKGLEKGMRDVRKLLANPDEVAESADGLAGEAANRLGGKPMWPGCAGISPPIDKALRAGKDPTDYRFAFLEEDVLLRYCARDVVATDRLAIHFDEKMKTEAAGVQHIWGTVIKPLSPALAKVEEWGMGADRQKIISIGRFFESKLKGAAQRLAPYEVNLNSAPQMRSLLFNRLGLKPTKFTATGAPSTDAEVLHALEGQHPIITDILTFRKYDKLLGTYSVGLVDHIRADKRIHPNVKPDGARSGRLSCVAPWTLVRTRRGLIPIIDVRVGDYVWTHAEKWQPVTRTIDQGREQVYDLRLSNGEVLTCTTSHRLLSTSQRWVTVGEIVEHFKSMGGEPGESWESSHALQAGASAPDERGDSVRAGDYLSQRLARAPQVHARGRAQGVGEAPIFCLENWDQESHAGEDGHGSPQLAGGVRGRPRLLDLLAQREAAVRSPDSDGGGPRSRRAAGNVRRLSYRRGPQEQRHRQPSAGDSRGAYGYSFFAGEGLAVVSVEAVHARGDCSVYDLTVATDHSYETCGVFSHNCTEPNLQNIPSEKEEEGRMLRDCFVAEPGNLIVSLDYSQIELRIAALLSGDPVMAQIYRDGDDFHMRTAKLISKMAWGITPDQVGAKHRREAKVFNFGLLYGMGDGRLARNLGITVQAARQVRAAILGSFKKLAEFIRECEKETRSTGFTWTWWDGQQARRRPLYDIADRDEKRKNTAENASFNTPVQGTASEFNTASLIECVDWIVGDCIPARLIIPIHDSLMFEVGEDNLVELVEGAQGIMTSWNSGNIPLVVDVEFGHSWGTMRSFTCEGLFNHPCGVKTPNAHCSSHGSTLTDEHKKLCCACVDLQRVRDATERLDGPAPA